MLRRTALRSRTPERKPRPDRSEEFASLVIVPTQARMATRLDAEAPVAQPREEVFRSEAWLRAVRSVPCVFCGQPSQAAHRNEGKGKAQKVDDCLTAALCVEHHAAIDQGKDMMRETRRAELDRAIVLTLRELARRGWVGVLPGK